MKLNTIIFLHIIYAFDVVISIEESNVNYYPTDYPRDWQINYDFSPFEIEPSYLSNV